MKKTDDKTIQEATDVPEAASNLGTTGDRAARTVNAPLGLNLREGPGQNFRVLAVLNDKTKVDVLDLPCGAKVPGWSLAQAGDQAGWVDDDFLTEA